MSDLIDAVRRARVFDASPTLEPGMPVFPGHPAVGIDAVRRHRSDGYYLQLLSLGEHTGSHVDAPAHALSDRTDATIDSYAASRFVAAYAIFDLSVLELGPGELASSDDLRSAAERDEISLEAGDAALLHFGWDRYFHRSAGWWAANTPGLDESACRFLVGQRVGLVGSDTATADTAVRNGEIIADFGHQTYFLPNDILLVEGLRGLGSAPKRGIMVAAPLKIARGSGAPARVLLISE